MGGGQGRLAAALASAEAGRIIVDLTARRGETPRFTPLAEGDFGLRVAVHLPGRATTLNCDWERSQVQTIPPWDAAPAEPLPPLWRELSLDRDIARLPGGRTGFLRCAMCRRGCRRRRRAAPTSPRRSRISRPRAG